MGQYRTIALDNVRLTKLAMVDGFALDWTAVNQLAALSRQFSTWSFRTAAAFSQV